MDDTFKLSSANRQSECDTDTLLAWLHARHPPFLDRLYGQCYMGFCIPAEAHVTVMEFKKINLGDRTLIAEVLELWVIEGLSI
jgi:hypothetical protein